MIRKRVRIDLSSEQLTRLRHEVLCNQQLSGEQRRKAAREILPIPSDGSPVDLYYDGEFVGSV